MVELKVNVDGVQRVVCGVSEATKCQDIILALAQATGQIGRFNLVEKCQDSERSLRPHENPLRVMSKWGPNSKDAYFYLRKTGSTPSSSRPPSVTKEISERFRQISSPTESIEDFPQQRQASVRRSQTFSGYRGGVTGQNLQSQEAAAVKEKAKHELSELVSMQQERIINQHQDLLDIEKIIQTLEGYDSQDFQHSDLESVMEEFELRSKKNKAELQEFEFWESELEIERQLQSVLTQKIIRLKDRIENCEQQSLLRQQEMTVLTQQIAEQRKRLQQEKNEAAKARLAEIQEELQLLNEENEDYTKDTQELDSVLAELNQRLDEKRSEETRLMEDLAKENMKEFTKTSTSQEETSLAHNTHSLVQPSRPRAASSPVEVYATFPFRRLISARHLTIAEPSGDSPEGIFV